MKEGRVVAGVGPEVGVGRREAVGAGDGGVEGFGGEGRGEDEGGVDLCGSVSMGLGCVVDNGGSARR